MGVTNQQAISYLENMKWLKGYDNTSITGISLQNIIDDIIGLLKEQEPHVLALNDIEKREVVWFEAKNSTQIEPILPRGKNFADETANWFRYNHEWRCWSARPTEERRKAAKWDGE